MFNLLLFTGFIIILIKLVLHFSYWSRYGVPNRPYPVFSWMYTTLDKYLLESNSLGHKVFGGYVLMATFLTVNDPQLAKDLSIKQADDFSIRTKFHIGNGSLEKSLFFLEANSDWKRIRNIITPSFTSGKLKAMSEPIHRIADQLIDNLRLKAREGKFFDIKIHVDGFTLDVIAQCAYGIQLDSVNQPDHPIIANAKRVLNTSVSFKQVLCFFSPTIAKMFNLKFFDANAVRYMDDLCETIIQKRQQSHKEYNDLIGLMMKEFKNGKDGITLEEISAQAILFFLAGYDTTNSAFDHTIYYLSQNPEWQDKLYEEVKDSSLEYDKLASFPVLNAIIYEVLRLKPSLIQIDRFAKRDCFLLDTGIPIKKDMNISIQPYIIHRDPEYFDDPETFNPERFIETGLENSVAYMPFGVGPRFCVGQRFALNELRIGISKFFTHFKAELESGFKLEYFTGSVLLSPNKIRVRLTERQ